MSPASLDLQAIVFDLDGTVIHSHDLISATVNRVLEGRGHPVVSAERIHAMTGLPLDEIFREVLPAAEVEASLACVDEYRDLFEREVMPAIRPIAGAAEAIPRVAAGPWPLAVATGRQTGTAVRMLKQCGLAHHFGAILGVDLVPRPKPYPDVLLAALERIGGADPRRVLVIGDSTVDVAMARAAEARVCAVTWGAQGRDELLSAEPDWCVDRWDQLLALVGLVAA